MNYNVQGLDITPMLAGMQAYGARQEKQQAQERQQQLEQLAQSALSGDQSALNQLAAIDSVKASQLLQLQKAQQPVQTKPVGKDELLNLASTVKMVATTSPDNLTPLLSKYSEQYPELATTFNQFDAIFKQSPETGMQVLDDFIGAGEKPAQPKTGRYVRERMGDELAIIDSASGRIIKKYPIPQSKKEQAELAKKTADIKKAETEAQLKAITADSEEEKIQASVDMAREASSLAKELANDENLGQAVGTLSTQLPTVRESTQDVINKAQRLESLLTVDNLKLMSGVLTDRDIAFLTRVASGLNISDGGIKGSESAVRKRLIEIANKIDSLMPSQQPSQQQNTQPASQGGAINWSDL